MKLIPSTQVSDVVSYPRGFFERWFTWPWRPNLIVGTYSGPRFETIGNLMYCSPETFKKIKLGEMPWPPGVTELDNR